MNPTHALQCLYHMHLEVLTFQNARHDSVCAPGIGHQRCWTFTEPICTAGYIGEFEYVDDHRAGKIVVELNGRWAAS